MKSIAVTVLITLLATTPVFSQTATQPASQTLELRIIVVGTITAAQELEDRLQAGESFEELATEFSADFSAEDGGYMGEFALDQLRPEYQAVLGGLMPGEVSAIARVDSEYVLLQVISVREGPNDDIWRGLTDQALAAIEAGDAERARTLLEDSVREAVKFGEEDYRVGASLTTLALFYHSEGIFEAAEPLYVRALGISENALGPDDPVIANTLDNLADLYMTTGNPERAEPLYLRAYEIYRLTLGPDDPDVSQTLHSLGLSNHARENLVRAKDFYTHALAIRERAQGRDGAQVGETVFNMAQLEQTMGNQPGALDQYRRALSIYELNFGTEDPGLIGILESYANLLDEMGQPREADSLRERAQAINRAISPPQ